AALEKQLHQALDELDAVKAAALERSQSSSSLFTEVELRVQLDAAKQSAEETEKALKEEVLRNQKLEDRLQNLVSTLKAEQSERSQRFAEQLHSLREERDDLDGKLAAEQQTGAGSLQRTKELEERLMQNAAEVERARAESERQAAERQ